MPLAFHLLAHKNPAQLRRLVDAIWAPENFFVIHYDRRRPAAEHRAVRGLTVGRSNIVIQQHAQFSGDGSVCSAPNSKG